MEGEQLTDHEDVYTVTEMTLPDDPHHSIKVTKGEYRHVVDQWVWHHVVDELIHALPEGKPQ